MAKKNEAVKAAVAELLSLEEAVGKRDDKPPFAELGGRDATRMTEQELQAAIAERKAWLATPKAPAPSAPAAKVEEKKTPSKQQVVANKLVDAIRARGDVDAKAIEMKQDGSNLLIVFNKAIVRIGKGGGMDIVNVRSYPKATIDVMAQADKLLIKQDERDAKKATAAATATAQTAKTTTPQQASA